MPKLAIQTHEIESPKRRKALLVEADGIISAPTLLRFRSLMARPLASGRDLILDLAAVTYMNSSALGELVRIHDEQQKRNLALVLTGLNTETGRLLGMLGLGNLLRIVPDRPAAIASLDEEFTAPSALPAAAPKRAAGVFIPVAHEAAPRLPDARILLAMDGDPYFARFLARCLGGKGGRTILVRDRAEAKAALEEGRIDLAILESQLPDARAICADLKCRRENGISSAVFLYPAQEDPADALTRVCEDEYVTEPFEVRELVSLAQGEFDRCRNESMLFVQEASFEASSREDAVAQVASHLETLLGQSGMATDAADGFFYAVREAMDNGRRHGNLSQPSRLIQVQYLLDREKVTVTIADEGQGFDVSPVVDRAKTVAPIEQARSRHNSGGYGGLGVGLMLRCCDKVEYIPPGNIVKLTKYL